VRINSTRRGDIREFIKSSGTKKKLQSKKKKKKHKRKCIKGKMYSELGTKKKIWYNIEKRNKKRLDRRESLSLRQIEWLKCNLKEIQITD
jgi:hypothetical protein